MTLFFFLCVLGIDLAFIENGYIYHTKYDTADRILTDSIQRAGWYSNVDSWSVLRWSLRADPQTYKFLVGCALGMHCAVCMSWVGFGVREMRARILALKSRLAIKNMDGGGL